MEQAAGITEVTQTIVIREVTLNNQRTISQLCLKLHFFPFLIPDVGLSCNPCVNANWDKGIPGGCLKIRGKCMKAKVHQCLR